MLSIELLVKNQHNLFEKKLIPNKHFDKVKLLE